MILSFLLFIAFQASPELDEKLNHSIQFDQSSKQEIGYLEIGGRASTINSSTWLYVHQAIEAWKVSRPIFVILKLNTPGGEVLPSVQIAEALRELDTQYGIPVIAYIDDWAISAGALIAYSCRFIAVAKGGAMGGAEPIITSPEGGVSPVSEKMISAMRAEFASGASFFGRNPDIAEAMVDKDTILVRRGEEIVKINGTSQTITNDPNSDELLSPQGKLLTLTADKLFEWGVADLLFSAPKLTPITDEEKEAGRWPIQKTPFYFHPFFQSIPQAEVVTFKMDFKSSFFAFLMTPLVSSILFFGLIVGAYLEFSAPGMILPGSLALICLFFLFLSNFAFELASLFDLTLILGGLFMLVVDLFFLPTFGLLGSFGLLLASLGFVQLLIPGLSRLVSDQEHFEMGGEEILKRISWLIGTLLVSIGAIFLITKSLLRKRSDVTHFLVLEGTQMGYTSGGNLYIPLVGKKGTAVSPLRPAGKIEIEGNRYDALSQDCFVDQGTAIIVERVEGSRIFVRAQSNG